jgi:hypothetical protein
VVANDSAVRMVYLRRHSRSHQRTLTYMPQMLSLFWQMQLQTPLLQPLPTLATKLHFQCHMARVKSIFGNSLY